MGFPAEQLWSDESYFALALLMDESGFGGCQGGTIFRNAFFCEGLGPFVPVKHLHFSWWTRCAAGVRESAAPASEEATPGLYRVTSANTQAQQNPVHDWHRCDAQVSTRSFASWRPVHLMISVSFRQTLWELNQIWHECNFTGCAFVSTLLHLLWVRVPGTACHHCSGGDADANSRYFWKVLSDVSSHQSMTVITGVSLYLYPLPLFAVTHKHDTFIDKDESVI